MIIILVSLLVLCFMIIADNLFSFIRAVISLPFVCVCVLCMSWVLRVPYCRAQGARESDATLKNLPCFTNIADRMFTDRYSPIKILCQLISHATHKIGFPMTQFLCVFCCCCLVSIIRVSFKTVIPSLNYS